jgi:DNA-binding NtrC family response regulator
MSTTSDLIAELSRSPSILVIDDDYFIGFIFKKLAQVYEIDLECVSTAQEGIEAVMKRRYDAVFLDMRFENGSNGLTGMDVLRQINLLNYENRIIVMSGSINLHDVMHEANKLGVLSFMAKPIDFTLEFVAAILKRLGLRLTPKALPAPDI